MKRLEVGCKAVIAFSQKQGKSHNARYQRALVGQIVTLVHGPYRNIRGAEVWTVEGEGLLEVKKRFFPAGCPLSTLLRNTPAVVLLRIDDPDVTLSTDEVKEIQNV